MPRLRFIKIHPCKICGNVGDGRLHRRGQGLGREGRGSRAGAARGVFAATLQVSPLLTFPGRLRFQSHR